MAVAKGKKRVVFTLSDFVIARLDEVADCYGITKSQLLSYMVVNDLIAGSLKFNGMDSMIKTGFFEDKDI